MSSPPKKTFPATCLFAVLAVAWLSSFALANPVPSPAGLDQELANIFVGRSFTIRNFYRGARLQYGPDGELTTKSEPGYWSRDGMVEISSVKISPDHQLIMQGKRTCVLFDPKEGEFSNVWTGDRVQIEVQLPPGQPDLGASLAVLKRVFITGNERLADLVPPFWANCVGRKVDRPDKKSAWECVVENGHEIPRFAGKKIAWDLPPVRDDTLHNGMKLYAITHSVGYIIEGGVAPPRLTVAPDPLFQWEQRRVALPAEILVFSATVGEDGKLHDLLIVSPVGMGLDDDAAQTLSTWRFSPGTLDGKPCPVQARIIFGISPPNTRMFLTRP
jgi:Gram-negative bacterial TonB protein C-terminal